MEVRVAKPDLQRQNKKRCTLENFFQSSVVQTLWREKLCSTGKKTEWDTVKLIKARMWKLLSRGWTTFVGIGAAVTLKFSKLVNIEDDTHIYYIIFSPKISSHPPSLICATIFSCIPLPFSNASYFLLDFTSMFRKSCQVVHSLRGQK